MVILSLNIVSRNLIGNFFYWNEIFVCMFSQFPVAFLKNNLFMKIYVKSIISVLIKYKCFLLGDKKNNTKEKQKT